QHQPAKTGIVARQVVDGRLDRHGGWAIVRRLAIEVAGAIDLEREFDRRQDLIEAYRGLGALPVDHKPESVGRVVARLVDVDQHLTGINADAKADVAGGDSGDPLTAVDPDVRLGHGAEHDRLEAVHYEPSLRYRRLPGRRIGWRVNHLQVIDPVEGCVLL